MEGFTIVDAIVAIVIVVSAILAYSRGFMREALAILGWVAAAVVAFLFAPAAEPLMREIPVVGDFLGDSCELSTIASFAAIFAVALVVAALFTPVFSSLVRNSALGGIDQGAGFLYGALRGIVLIAVAFVVYERAMPAADMAVVDDSRSAAVFARLQQGIDEAIPEEVPGWLVQRYEQLMSNCTQ